MVAKTVGRITRDVEQTAQNVAAARNSSGKMALVVGSRASRQAVFRLAWRDRRVSGENLEHAARRIAVKLGQWAAQQLDALGRSQAGGRCLALAVWHGGRNTINQDAHAAHAKGRARAKATHRQLQVLREVLPVPDLQAGHTAHQLRQIDQRRRRAKRVNLDRVDSARRIKTALLGAAGADDDFFQRIIRVLLRLGGGHHHRRCQQSGAGQADAMA